MHHIFRGPIRLKEFMVYTPMSGNHPQKYTHHQERRHGPHGHQHFHDKLAKRPVADRRDIGDVVVATIDNKVVSWTKQGGVSTSSPNPSKPKAASSHAGSKILAPVAPPRPGSNKAPNEEFVASSSPGQATSSNSGSEIDANGHWSRVAFYNAEQGKAEGLVFLANAWDGNLVYASGGGVQTQAGRNQDPAILQDILVDQNNEFIIASDIKCNEDDCGLVYPGAKSLNYDAARPSATYRKCSTLWPTSITLMIDRWVERR
jgi:hypothetical protein